MWKSAANPSAPVELIYDFARPVVIQKVQLHQHTEWPTSNVEVLTSDDGVSWTSVMEGVVPQASDSGANFAFLFTQGLGAPARKVKIRLLGGYRPEHWGLGEIELFGTGAVMQTDDDWYRVNADATSLEAGASYHYRLVTLSGGVVAPGNDMTFTVPATTKPEATTGPATRIAASSAKLEGRLNTLGAEAELHFEYGDSVAYGQSTTVQRAGPEITPRTVVAALTELVPGTTVHYRLVVAGEAGTTYGNDLTFLAK